MSFLNKISLFTITFAAVNILIVIISDVQYVPIVSAIFGWIVVITTQLSLISIRLENEKNDTTLSTND